MLLKRLAFSAGLVEVCQWLLASDSWVEPPWPEASCLNQDAGLQGSSEGWKSEYLIESQGWQQAAEEGKLLFVGVLEAFVWPLCWTIPTDQAMLFSPRISLAEFLAVMQLGILTDQCTMF